MDRAVQNCARTDALIEQSTAVILAGGEAKRMGGQMKSGLLWQGETFLTVLYRELSPFPRRFVSVDRKERFDPSLETAEDLYPGCGPLGAIATGLAQARTPLVFFTACDTPLLTMRLVRFLYGCWRDGLDACIAKTGDGRSHPLCGIYRKSLEPAARACLEGGERRVMRFLAGCAVCEAAVPLALEGQLFNVNTPQAYEALRRAPGQ